MNNTTIITETIPLERNASTLSSMDLIIQIIEDQENNKNFFTILGVPHKKINISPEIFLEHFDRFFSKYVAKSEVDLTAKPILLKGLDFLKKWVNEYPDDFYSPTMQESLINCVNKYQPLKDLVITLKFSEQDIKQKISISQQEEAIHLDLDFNLSEDTTLAVYLSGEPLQVVKQCFTSILPLNILDVDAMVIAECITYIDWKFFKSIKPRYFLFYALKEDKTIHDQIHPNISAWIKWTNCVNAWVQYEIFYAESKDNRVKLIKHFTKIAKKCHDLRNYSSLFAIIAGVVKSKSLKATWNDVPEKTKAIIEQYNEMSVPDKNYVIFRAEIANHRAYRLATIPFFGIFNKDFYFSFLMVQQAKNSIDALSGLRNITNSVTMNTLVDMYKIQSNVERPSNFYVYYHMLNIQQFQKKDIDALINLRQLYLQDNQNEKLSLLDYKNLIGFDDFQILIEKGFVEENVHTITTGIYKFIEKSLVREQALQLAEFFVFSFQILCKTYMENRPSFGITRTEPQTIGITFQQHGDFNGRISKDLTSITNYLNDIAKTIKSLNAHYIVDKAVNDTIRKINDINEALRNRIIEFRNMQTEDKQNAKVAQHQLIEIVEKVKNLRAQDSNTTGHLVFNIQQLNGVLEYEKEYKKILSNLAIDEFAKKESAIILLENLIISFDNTITAFLRYFPPVESVLNSIVVKYFSDCNVMLDDCLLKYMKDFSAPALLINANFLNIGRLRANAKEFTRTVSLFVKTFDTVSKTIFVSSPQTPNYDCELQSLTEKIRIIKPHADSSLKLIE